LSISPAISPLASLLRCLECAEQLELDSLIAPGGYPDLGPDGWLSCRACGERYPLIAGTVRMLSREARRGLARSYPDALLDLPRDQVGADGEKPSVKELTAKSFAYEWQRFGAFRPEWHKNFVDYLRPLAPESLAGRLVLDVGTGSGRHSAQAAAYGARVVAVDLGESIDVARRNLPPDALTVQADAERLPFAPGSFDVVMSIGVLHHVPDPEAALRALVPLAAPTGHLHVYFYWAPERPSHRAILRLVSAARRVTVRMPHRLLHVLCYPMAALQWIGAVLPYRLLRRYRVTAALADPLPLKTYADYPFAVLVNDTFDRFSAPIEHRLGRVQVQEMLQRAGLQEIAVVPNHGWIGDGVVPETQPAARERA
jgi:2-polyprenyl-3-methyl-5-hydroxy-6-metoxy-1,4-benzoquinol methylase/uncharacterized protein YbaR (Trm112 family)